MRMRKTGIVGAFLTILAVAGTAVAGAAVAQDAPTQAVEPKAAEPKAAEPKAAEPKAPATTTAATQPVKAKPAAKGSASKSVIGEVVDPACWVVNGAKGEAHKECALACAKAGQVLAILERKTNKLFLLATERPGEDPNKGVIDYCGQTVVAKGRIFTRGGVTAIQIASVEPYNAKAAP